MPGGMPTVEVILSWPVPNYVDPVTRPPIATILSCTLGLLTFFLMSARLWVRFYVQRNAGLDDWLMLASFPFICAVTVLVILSSDVFHGNRHTWNLEFQYFVLQRKFILAVETNFVVASALIKISILLFYRRLGARGVSRSFRMVTWFSMGFVTAYSVGFIGLALLGCQPMSDNWEAADIHNVLSRKKIHCVHDNIPIFTAGVISTVQDFVTALLPTFIYWKAQIPFRQKALLFCIFAVAYVVVAFGVIRTHASWVIFFESYDVSWYLYELWNWTLIELHLGAICANAPALRAFFKTYFKSKSSESKPKSPRLPNLGNSEPKQITNNSQSSGKQSQSSGKNTASSRKNSQSTGPTSPRSKLSFWNKEFAIHGYISQNTGITIDEEQGDVGVNKEYGVRALESVHTANSDCENAGLNYDVDLEAGQLTNVSSHSELRPPETSFIWHPDSRRNSGRSDVGGWMPISFRHLRPEV